MTEATLSKKQVGSGGLVVRGLSAGYGKALVLDNLHLEVPSGEVVAVVGPNGAGKSTLVRCISGVIKPRAGEVVFDGTPITGLPSHAVARRGLLHVPETRDIFGGMTVWENLRVAFDNLNSPANEQAAFSEVYELFPILKQRANDVAGNLSGGQQQMLAIARAMLGRPKLLILDEPSLGLARLIIREIYAALDRLRQAGYTVLLIEQNATMAIRFADRAVVLVNGEIVLRGSRDELASNPMLTTHYLGGNHVPASQTGSIQSVAHA
ncbi:ABC transporter ATP-binding protein [Variovorax sp. VNK109]|uniref:ABC transporter ATP-binding protein n=1 Tax=Variovorax sp. VNK109 TaxID=3400919 RepID=UPI003BFD0A5B